MIQRPSDPSFAEVLEQCLRDDISREEIKPAQAPREVASTTAVDSMFFENLGIFADLQRGPHWPRPKAYSADSPLKTREVAKQKWLSRLTPQQRRAADFLITLGEDEFCFRPTRAQVKKCYRRLASRLHPDCHFRSSDAVKKSYERQFVRLGEAVQTLLDGLDN